MGENSPYQQNFMDVLQILSLWLGYENLIENREQSAHNDVQAANENQKNEILESLKIQFDDQNVMLKEILLELRALNDVLYRLLLERS